MNKHAESRITRYPKMLNTSRLNKSSGIQIHNKYYSIRIHKYSELFIRVQFCIKTKREKCPKCVGKMDKYKYI